MQTEDKKYLETIGIGALFLQLRLAILDLTVMENQIHTGPLLTPPAPLRGRRAPLLALQNKK